MNVSGTSHPPSISGNQQTQQSDQKNGNSSGMSQAIKVVASTSQTPDEHDASVPVAQASSEKNETKIVSEIEQETIDIINKWWKSMKELSANRASHSKQVNEYQKRKLHENAKTEKKYMPKVHAMVMAYGYDTVRKLLVSPEILGPAPESATTPKVRSHLETLANQGNHGQRKHAKKQLKKAEAGFKSNPNIAVQSKGLATHSLAGQKPKQ